MKRIFIAVKIEAGPGLIRTVSTFKAVLGGENIKWTDLSNSHLTLAFLGDTEEERTMPLNILLKERCNGSGNFSFLLKGAGVFKSLRDPRVIWIGIDLPDKLVKIHHSISAGLQESGFHVEDRPFRPHLTIGRIKYLNSTDNLKNLIEKYRDAEIQKVEVNEIILYESILLPGGPVYNPLIRSGL